jgi:flagellar biosynthetic protein FlhB
MADASASEKTEKPTAKRLKDAREQGQVPRSQDLVAAAALLAVTAALARTGGNAITRLESRVAEGLHRTGDIGRGTITPADLASQVMSDLTLMAIVVGPLLATAAMVALAGHFGQSGWIFAPERLKPDFTRLSPANGLARLKPSQSWLDLLKTIAAATLIGILAYHIVFDVLADSPRLAWMTTSAAAIEGWEYLRTLLLRVGFALVAIAGLDYGLQRWRHYTSLKMSKQELRDEAKSNDGNPEIKARVRKVQREMNRARMLNAVKTATVVITNPTHFAVALEYRRGQMAAPIVVAKGQDLMAARIKEIARDAGVPTVENVSLARALFTGAEVGDAIPADLFGAVAEVLAYLVRIKQLML